MFLLIVFLSGLAGRELRRTDGNLACPGKGRGGPSSVCGKAWRSRGAARRRKCGAVVQERQDAKRQSRPSSFREDALPPVELYRHPPGNAPPKCRGERKSPLQQPDASARARPYSHTGEALLL